MNSPGQALRTALEEGESPSLLCVQQEELAGLDAGDAVFRQVQFRRCRFTDCKHESEPGCAIRAAIESGELSKERWESYKQLELESDRSRRLGARMKQGQPSRTLAKSRRQQRKYKGKNFPGAY